MNCKKMQANRIVSIFLLIILTFSCISLPTSAESVRGNSTGNIVNIGFGYAYSDRDDFVDGLYCQFVNIYNGYLYYVDQRNGGCLYRKNLSSGKVKKLSKSKDTAYVNVVDDYIFFVDVPAGYKITRTDLDGSNRTQLCKLSASRLCAYNGYLYFANWKGDNTGLWRIDYNGNNKKQLTSGDVPLYINVNSYGIYWISNNTKNICKTTFDGKTTRYKSIKNATCLNMVDDIAYFVWDGPQGYGVYMSDDLSDTCILYQAGKKENTIDCLSVCPGCVFFRVNGGQKSNKTDGKLKIVSVY